LTVTFCGHGNYKYSTKVKESLYRTLEKLIKEGADKFYLGGYGDFDLLLAETLKKLKEIYPKIESILVIPYLNKSYSMLLYDSSIYPPIENTPPKFAIVKRNEWMVEKSDVVISFVEHDFGGAYKTLAYAEKKKKQIIRI